jgi:hypothetical protein
LGHGTVTGNLIPFPWNPEKTVYYTTSDEGSQEKKNQETRIKKKTADRSKRSEDEKVQNLNFKTCPSFLDGGNRNVQCQISIHTEKYFG